MASGRRSRFADHDRVGISYGLTLTISTFFSKYRRSAAGMVYQRVSFPARELTRFELSACRWRVAVVKGSQLALLLDRDGTHGAVFRRLICISRSLHIRANRR